MSQKAGWDKPGRSLGNAGSSWLLFAALFLGCKPLVAPGAPVTAAGGQSPARTPLPAPFAILELVTSLDAYLRWHGCVGLLAAQGRPPG